MPKKPAQSKQTSSEQSNSDLTQDQLKFVEWLITPKAERDPATQNELARTLRVEPKTLSRWKHNEAFQAEYKKRLDEIAGDADVQVIQAIIKNAIECAGRDGAPDRKLYLEWRGLLTKKQEIEHKGNILNQYVNLDFDKI